MKASINTVVEKSKLHIVVGQQPVLMEQKLIWSALKCYHRKLLVDKLTIEEGMQNSVRRV